ncbi:DUF1566 domain-containing protein [Salibacter halophilus]|uniref:DUF1566 domain-containing protein n=1 Tax=Salibacter halophilus TaxID=1803916 RepID=A0A6N6M6Q4_9FLAO|nr:DUF1566 domain-containing protein [Salibacter halophilus]KAB1065592.1 DUF1566 domain-containing protein [Salibacter halophilus]
MKRLTKIIGSLVFVVFSVLQLNAQSPNKFTYQAVVRNADGELVKNSTVGLRISILQGSATGNLEYEETHSVQSNANGLVSLQIGDGNTVDDLNAIDWSAGPFYLQTEVDFEGGSNYELLGVTQLVSVPYSLHAGTADSVINGFDGQYSSLSGTPTNVSSFTNDAGYLTSEQDGDATNELQVLTISNDTIYLSNGGFVELPAGFDGQYSSLSGTPTNVSSFTNDAGYLTSEQDGDATNELQVLTISNDTIYLSNGGFVELPAGFDGQYSSLSGTPTNVSVFTNDAGYLTSEQDGDATNELQVLTISNDTIYLSNGGFVALPAGFDGQYSSLSGTPTNVSSFTNDAGYLTSEQDGDDTNELQVLTISNDTIYLSNGGFVELPAGFDGQYSSLSGTPTNVSSFTNDAGYLTSEQDADSTNELQVLTISNDTVFLSNGGFAELPGMPAGSNVGDMRYWDGSEWVEIPIGQPGQVLQVNSNGVPAWLGAGYASVSTISATSTSPIDATFNGDVTSNNGSPVTDYGFCWSVNPQPTLSDSFQSVGSGTGNFSLNLSNLNGGQTYYVRAYATNGAGTNYGNEVSFTMASAYSIGSTGPAGGIVFYDKGSYSNGWRYLESSTTDQSTNSQWGCSGTNLPGASGSGYGDGYQNTQDIVAGCGGTIAASIANNLNLNGYSDWFLPSRNSLDLMYQNLFQSGLGNFAVDTYWSSTEASSISGYAYNFYSGGVVVNNKVVNYRVRAIRRF